MNTLVMSNVVIEVGTGNPTYGTLPIRIQDHDTGEVIIFNFIVGDGEVDALVRELTRGAAEAEAK